MNHTLALMFLLLSSLQANAWECIDCDKKCCKKVLGAKICEPVCRQACSVANIGCGQVEIPTTPVTPPIVVPLPEVTPEVIVAVATGGMVNPITKPAAEAAVKEIAVAVKNIAREIDKGLKDSEAEIGRAGRQIETAGQAIAEYVEEKTKGTVAVLDKALERVREGKVVDALWHIGTDTLRVEDQAAASAAMKSDLIRTVGQVAASAYGGPGGSAAYSAWLTYHQSGGDINLALRVGIITGATAWAIQTTGQLPVQDASGNLVVSDAVKKVAVTGAIGGLAVAAAGGDENAVRDGFVRAGAMVLVQEGYKVYTKHSLQDPKSLQASKGAPYCVSSTVDCQQPPPGAAVYKDGKFVGWDQSKLDNTAPHVGTGFPDTPITEVTWPSEGSPLMQGVSKIPGMNAMAVFHDQWALDWKMPAGVLQGTIYPAVVITYNGTTAPLMENIRKVAQKDLATESARGDSTRTVLVLQDDVPESAPVIVKNVDTAILCVRGEDTRSILLESDPQKKNFACRVAYRSNLTRKVPWLAKNDINYCLAPVRSLLKKSLELGYQCLESTATRRIAAVER